MKILVTGTAGFIGFHLANTLAERAAAVGLSGHVVGEVTAAIKMARAGAGTDDLVFIGGSTFVVAEIENL